ncbi:hypothetical protein T02_15426 [Trichinella nativa]|uniref:FLYWCH-type domain-containing protein n=1 Tax=Trichinella nativa TaxID=6335 RepID=A0A0V1KQ83_9BILA|nr:hypothetical protein T02_1001 [Trichinella nativa]KRZ49271.1 hypothetical protein T02_15426 [Trichinella nativa]
MHTAVAMNDRGFVSTQRAKQKLVHRREYSTLKRTNHIKKCWICASPESCAPLLYTNQDATQVIRNVEHTYGCRVNSPTFYYQQQLNELKQLVAGDLRPILPHVFHRDTMPGTHCTTAVPVDTHDIRPGGRIWSSLLSRQQQKNSIPAGA